VVDAHSSGDHCGGSHGSLDHDREAVQSGTFSLPVIVILIFVAISVYNYMFICNHLICLCMSFIFSISNVYFIPDYSCFT
jgi:hypothetical protein